MSSSTYRASGNFETLGRIIYFPQEQTLSVFYTRRPIFTPRDVFYAVRLQEN